MPGSRKLKCTSCRMRHKACTPGSHANICSECGGLRYACSLAATASAIGTSHHQSSSIDIPQAVAFDGVLTGSSPILSNEVQATPTVPNFAASLGVFAPTFPIELQNQSGAPDLASVSAQSRSTERPDYVGGVPTLPNPQPFEESLADFLRFSRYVLLRFPGSYQIVLERDNSRGDERDPQL
ncbi:uncharacterized protein EI90DRAFT_3029940 [Cantharellus anzutake]|uniref:uncharacterized protein n=1 Tax=Cantharellus anzutake TaxID=1750568 RepID=UPI0019040ED8|nr:uncharacterized protein EI90DRAFT_3029940 [Cantharellus anzutake]KAF8342700.1 hypothetical protein EI90DRAFT_3029940 [Cantharellus anzutake]